MRNAPEKVKLFDIHTFTWDSFEHKSYYIRGKAAYLLGKEVRMPTFAQSVINCLGVFLSLCKEEQKALDVAGRTYGRTTNANKVVAKNLNGK